MSLVSRSGPICRLVVGAIWATLVGQAVVSCSSNSARPNELGDCVKTGDAACTTPDPGGGKGGPGGESGAGDGGAVGDTASGCGVAQDELASQNTSCVPCVERGTGATGISCCQSDQACSAQTDTGGCLVLLGCMLRCTLTDTGCQGLCENAASVSGIQTYNQFAACLSQNCSPQCPTLPQGGTTDL